MARSVKPDEVIDTKKTQEEAAPKTIVVEKEKIGGSITWIVCIVLILAMIHFSCQAGSATGYLQTKCTEGLGIIDILGIVCCAPVYLIILVVLSGGIKIW